MTANRILGIGLIGMVPAAGDGADFTDFRSQSYGCQFIAAEKRHYGDADKCRRPERAGSAFCPAHHAVVFVAAAERRAVRAP